jgi:outer membrane receptor protein involved in Fe transport
MPTDTTSVRLIHTEDEQTNTTAGLQTFINYDVAYRFGWQVGIAEAHDIASRAIGVRGFSITANASDGEAKGVDLEVLFLATDQLSFGANLGWLDTQYVDIKPTAQLRAETEFGGAPEETYDVCMQHDWRLAGGGSSAAGDITRWNARAVFTPGDADWELSIFANNITDEIYLNSGFMDSIWQFDFSGVDAPREYGVGLSMRF